ncbi:MAG: hypothetical protein JST23_08240 [Bacteroidetes bacterium]|nr:hypothetical protein [Bacteroidota bacterium]
MRFWFVLILFVQTSLLSAQQFGGNPSAIKWKQINNTATRVIFPQGLDSQASRITSLIDYIAAQTPVSLGNQQKKINLVLQNQTIIPNAYVGLSPFRSEFFMTPPTNNFEQGGTPWPDLLALHEYRHVEQFNNAHVGLSKLIHKIFGDDGFALSINAAIPDWFFEGDAVYQETILSRQGRGRLSLFMNEFPALWQAGKKYSWMKLRNGSFKDFVPNHYNLGYPMVKYGYEQYGTSFWKNIIADAASWKGLFYPFQTAIKKHTGISYAEFRQKALNVLASESKQDTFNDKDFLFSVNKKYVTNYFFPYQINKDSLLYLKSSFRSRPAFYIKDNKGEHRIKIRDISIDEQYSYRNGKIVYAAYNSDPRRAWRDYSIIKELDIATGVERSITAESKYFTPDISPDGNSIIAVQNSSDGKSVLHLLNVRTGAVVKELKSAEISVFTDPKFIDDQQLITAVRLKDGKMALALANIETGNLLRITPPSYNVIGYPNVEKDFVFFTANFSGDDNIFVLKLSDKKVMRITNGQAGKYYVNAQGDKLVWSEFTAFGYQLKEKNIAPSSWQEVDEHTMTTQQIRYPILLPKIDYADEISEIETNSYKVEKYKKSTRLINIHSWRPYYDDPEFSYTIYGQNILNTFQSELYYLYNKNEKTNAIGANAIYGAWFPQLVLGAQYTLDRNAAIGNKTRYWNQADAHIGIGVPLNFAKGKTYKGFNLGTNFYVQQNYNRGIYKDSLGNTQLSYLHHYLVWNQFVPQAKQHILPRLGYSVSLAERYTVTEKKGNQFLLNSAIYLPGIASVHNLVFTGAFQERDTMGNVSFTNRFSYSRGYEGRYFSRMWRVSANYHFPLFYPDWGFANLLYISRVRANAFYDFTKVYSKNKLQTVNQRSAGAEIYLDTRWWNQYPLSFGFRFSRLLDKDQFNGFKGNRFEFILPVSIIPH